MKFNRRDFLKSGALLAAGWLLPNFPALSQAWGGLQAAWPDGERLGRVCTAKAPRYRAPDPKSPLVDELPEDTVVAWLREAVGQPQLYRLSRRWIETPEGYLYAPDVQPVAARPNPPLAELPLHPQLGRGLWAEVTIPYALITLRHKPSSFWIKGTPTPRIYYSQVYWIDDLQVNEDGQTLYQVYEKYGRDRFWAPAEAFRPLDEADLAPINPGAADKKVRVNLNQQTMTCLEGKAEVFFCRIASGRKLDADGSGKPRWVTPQGAHLIWRKLISHHMSAGGPETGFDLPGIAWTCLFASDGAAIHSTYWHNDYGTPRSHGCINAAPEDARWVFRWSEPHVAYGEGERIINRSGISTTVEVIAG